ncbi:hypothetical protein vseg_017499 [Gypsophila vaccaria]
MMIMMIKEKGDVRPLLVKFGVALAISFAGFLYARVRTKRIRRLDPPPSPPPSNSESTRRVHYEERLPINGDPQPEMDSDDAYDKPRIRVRDDSLSVRASSSVRCGEDKVGLLLPEFDHLVKNLNASNTSNPYIEDFATNKIPKTIFSVERDDYAHEIDILKKRVKFLREREKNLEVHLLEYYGLKEQETTMMELQNRLKINNIEAKLFSVKIESLQAENKRLATQIVDHSKVVSELEDAKDKIKVLKRKIRHEAQQNRERITELTQRVAQFQEQEHEDAHSELHRMVHLEREAEELRKVNESLQQENADLIRRLDSTQFLANSLLGDPEKDELSKEMFNLREENDSLSKEVERLRADRCTDAEELVYLRWINACLRYELRNYQPLPGKTVARDLSKCLSPTSEQKAKQLILEYANSEDGDQKVPSIVDFDFDRWPSTNPSYLTDSTEHDDSPRHTSDHKHHHKKLKIFARLRKLITGKHGHTTRVDYDILKRRPSESPHSFYDGGIDDSPKLASASQNSNTSSPDYQPLSRLDEQDPNDMEKTVRMSESTSSPGGTRFVLGSESTTISPLDYRIEHDSEDGSKSQLAKFAEVLRDSRLSPRMHKKSASCA